MLIIKIGEKETINQAVIKKEKFLNQLEK